MALQNRGSPWVGVGLLFLALTALGSQGLAAAPVKAEAFRVSCVVAYGGKLHLIKLWDRAHQSAQHKLALHYQAAEGRYHGEAEDLARLQGRCAAALPDDSKLQYLGLAVERARFSRRPYLLAVAGAPTLGQPAYTASEIEHFLAGRGYSYPTLALYGGIGFVACAASMAFVAYLAGPKLPLPRAIRGSLAFLPFLFASAKKAKNAKKALVIPRPTS